MVHGSGVCEGDGDCRPPNRTDVGYCDGNRCVCTAQHTGPYCKAPPGFNDIEYDYNVDLLPHPVVTSVYMPASLASFLSIVAVAFVTVVLYIKYNSEYVKP